MKSVICVYVALFIIKSESLPSEPNAPEGSVHNQAVGLSFSIEKNEDDKECVSDCLCLTPGCIKAANEVLDSINENVDPCDDMYEFACGKYIKETIIPDDELSSDWFAVADDKVTQQLRIVLEEPCEEKDLKPFKLAKELYKSCMDTARIKELGLDRINELIHDLGGWPVLKGEEWDQSKFFWKDTVCQLKDKGFSVNYLIDFSVDPDFKETLKRSIYLDQPQLCLQKEYLDKGMEDEMVRFLYSYMVDVSVMFGADRSRAEKELKEVVELEIELAKISTPQEDRRNFGRLYNAMTIPKLQEKYPFTNWFEYISTILGKSVTLEPEEVVVVLAPAYLEGLGKILDKTSKRTLANYLLWRAVSYSVSFLTEDLRHRELEFFTAALGQKEREPRWKECVSIVTGSFMLAVGSLYVRRFFDRSVKSSAEEIANNIIEEMQATLETVDWLNESPKTRNIALDKAKAMTSHIAYPDELLDDNKLNEFYKKHEIPQGKFFESVLILDKFSRDFSFSRLREKVDKKDWISHGLPAVVNAMYKPDENSLVFPAGILQGRFFSHDRQNYMNYGSIGSLMGQGITHGFDDVGRQFDKEGNLVDWWDEKTKEVYLEKTKCIIKQYDNYVVEQIGLNLNGVNTQEENIADNGGAKLAYRAYNRWVAQHGQEKRLPGLQKYTPKQMFWISFANTWCEKVRSETLKVLVTTDAHAPGEYRVKGPFSNMPEFAKDFKCKEGARMNPPNTKRCTVW